MNSPKLLTALLATGAAVVAQAPLRISSLDTTPLVWLQNIEAGTAVIEYDEQAGERTLLFAHVTIDETVAGTIVAAGVINALPFLASPAKQQWQLSATELENLGGHHFTGYAPMVPPRRIAQHLMAYDEASNKDAYGTSNSLTIGFETHQTHLNIVTNVILANDERKAWANTFWNWDATVNLYSFDCVQSGREAVVQSAHEYVAAFSLPPVNQTAINNLNLLMDSSLGFEIHVQAAHVKPAGANEVDVRISRSTRIRRRSLHQTEQWPFGPRRLVPAPTSSDINIYLAPRGDFLHLEFPVDVGTLANPTSLRAYVPTANGLVLVDQVANPTFEGVLLKPHVGIFPCPADAVDGICYIEEVSNPGQRFEPLGHYGRAAVVSAYDIPPGTIIPPAPPSSPVGGGQPPQ